MLNQQSPPRAQEIAELIERVFVSGEHFVTRIVNGDSIYINGVPKNKLKAGTHTQTSITYVITQLPNGVAVLGPDSAYQEPGKILHALTLNVEDDLALRYFKPSMRLPQIVELQLSYS